MNPGTALALLAVFSQAALAGNLVEHGCSVVFQEDGKTQIKDLPPETFSILRYTGDKQFLKLVGPNGTKAVAVLCHRSSIIPAEQDFQVLRAGYVFYIKDSKRTVVLELVSAEFRFTLLNGPPLSTSEKKAVDKMLRSYPKPHFDQ